MKKNGLILLSFIGLLTLAGCGPSEDELKKAQEAEEKAKIDAAIAKKDAERWKTYTYVAISVGAVLLFVGAGLGAGAKRDAKKQ